MMNQKLTKQELLKAEGVGWKQFAKDNIAKRKNTIVALNNSSDDKSTISRKSTNIDIIRNVKPKEDIRTSTTKTIEKKNNVPAKSLKADATINVKRTEKNKNAKSESKLNSARDVKSSITLDGKKNSEENKKTKEKHIRSVSDILNVVSTTRAKSISGIKNINKYSNK